MCRKNLTLPLSFDRRGHLVDDGPWRLAVDERPKILKNGVAVGFVLDDAVGRELLRPDLELRLDEDDDLCALIDDVDERGQDELQRDERYVDHRQPAPA